MGSSTTSSPESPINFFGATTSAAADILFSLQNRVVKGRKIEMKRLADGDEIESCQVLFIASQDEAVVRSIMERVQGRQILSIGETESFARMGGVINFFVAKNQLRFEVNLDAAESAGLKFSSQLLMSADIVKKREE